MNFRQMTKYRFFNQNNFFSFYFGEILTGFNYCNVNKKMRLKETCTCSVKFDVSVFTFRLTPLFMHKYAYQKLKTLPGDPHPKHFNCFATCFVLQNYLYVAKNSFVLSGNGTDYFDDDSGEILLIELSYILVIVFDKNQHILIFFQNSLKLSSN